MFFCLLFMVECCYAECCVPCWHPLKYLHFMYILTSASSCQQVSIIEKIELFCQLLNQRSSMAKLLIKTAINSYWQHVISSTDISSTSSINTCLIFCMCNPYNNVTMQQADILAKDEMNVGEMSVDEIHYGQNDMLPFKSPGCILFGIWSLRFLDGQVL